MKLKNRILKETKHSVHERGAMMVELLLTLALIAVVLPFVINFQKTRAERAKNIVLTQKMENVSNALERYIDLHKKELMTTIGKNITRVNIADLVEYGVSESTVDEYGDDFQVRILKSNNRDGRSILQGVIVLNDADISALRTREIINLGGGDFGFVEDNQAFGAFGTWHANTSDLGVSGTGGIIETTQTKLDAGEYLWRVPSTNTSDATMLSGLNLGGHNIIGAKFADVASGQFEEIFKAGEIVADRIVFQNRTTIDNYYESGDVNVAGTLSADSRNMEISGVLTLNDTAKLSNLTTNDLWVNNLNLSGLSISSDVSGGAVLKATQTIDMVAGHITALLVTVGFTGSITPRLVVRDKIEDPANPNFFWDAAGETARMADISINELNRLAAAAARNESGNKTQSGAAFNATITNKNATVSDFMNVISEIQNRVRVKYRQLNLE